MRLFGLGALVIASVGYGVVGQVDGCMGRFAALDDSGGVTSGLLRGLSGSDDGAPDGWLVVQAEAYDPDRPLSLRFHVESAEGAALASSSITWSFGDGGTNTGLEVRHTYRAEGDFTVRAEAYDPQTQTGSTGQSVVRVRLFHVDVSASPSHGQAPLTTRLAGDATLPCGHSAVSYRWELPDGEVVSTVPFLERVIATPGVHTIGLTVVTDRGWRQTGTATVTVEDPNRSPTAAIDAPPGGGTAPLTIRVTAQCSTDPDGVIAFYRWDFGDGSGADGPEATHEYPSPGEYTLTLTVTDNLGQSNTASAVVKVTDTGGSGPTDEDLDAVAELPVCRADAEWLAAELAGLATRQPGGKPIIWAGGYPPAWMAGSAGNQVPTQAIVELVRTTGSVPVRIGVDSACVNWYPMARDLAAQYNAVVTAVIAPLEFYYFQHVLEAQYRYVWNCEPLTGVYGFSTGICLETEMSEARSYALQMDLQLMGDALQAAHDAGLAIDYFYVDLEKLLGSWSNVLNSDPACPPCQDLASHDLALLALRSEIASRIREYYPDAKQVWYNMGWSVNARGQVAPDSTLTQFWPADLQELEEGQPSGSVLSSPSFFFGDEESLYYDAPALVTAELPAGAAFAPTIAIGWDGRSLAWGDWDPRVTASAVTSYLSDESITGVAVFPCLLAYSSGLPLRHCMVNRQLYAVAWAATRE